MRARAIPTFAAYGELLRRDPAEARRLLEALTIHVSRFYRNPETWDWMRRHLLPALWDRCGGALRCWSAGCATGEEPYTLALLLLEEARQRGSTFRGHVDASDFDEESLARGAQGLFPRAAIRDLPADLAQRYLDGREPVRVAPEARQLIRWVRHDLTRDPPPAPPYDLVLCRNVLIYFEPAVQARLAAAVVQALAPGGYLVLGKVEAIRGEARDHVVLENARERIYRRI
jgi:chemotaxis methyl-accepting protein methylase